MGLGYCEWVQDRFSQAPHTRTRPRVGMSAPLQQDLFKEEVTVRKLEAEQGFYSSLFLVPKKDRGMRPVINLKGLNEFVVTHDFKMEDLHTMKDILKRGD